jgi:hypothetical protein
MTACFDLATLGRRGAAGKAIKAGKSIAFPSPKGTFTKTSRKLVMLGDVQGAGGPNADVR